MGHGASGVGMQAIADPKFELGGVVALKKVARAGRYEWAAWQHIAAKIGNHLCGWLPYSRNGDEMRNVKCCNL